MPSKKRPHVELVPEPGNTFDTNAIRVEVGGEHVGYVPKKHKSATAKPGVTGRLIKIGTTPAPHVWIFLER